MDMVGRTGGEDVGSFVINAFSESDSMFSDPKQSVKILIFLFFLVGFAFKLSAFPSHTWAPEVYEGSSNPVTAFILIPVKLACFGILARALTQALWFNTDT